METAKVEIRKLQLLNDRINQCIDALNQVRLSVHGLSHATGVNPATAGIAQSQNPYQTQSPFQAQSPFQTQNPYGASPFGAGYAPGFGQQGGANPSPFGIGQTFNPALGLSHTSAEGLERPVWTDPVMAARIAQTFPYLYLPVSPAVGTIY